MKAVMTMYEKASTMVKMKHMGTSGVSFESVIVGGAVIEVLMQKSGAWSLV